MKIGPPKSYFSLFLYSGYLAPEYAIRGQLTEKADVFGFGIVALEVIYGRMNTDHSMGPDKTYLLEWVCASIDCFSLVQYCIGIYIQETFQMRYIKMKYLVRY